jgi:hypothetical protein
MIDVDIALVLAPDRSRTTARTQRLAPLQLEAENRRNRYWEDAEHGEQPIRKTAAHH